MLINPINPISSIRTEPDSILAMLQKITQEQLNDCQLEIAKKSIAELPADMEITILDLYQLWDGSPALSGFAKGLKKNLLPS
ncbi:MAG TPA: hypothetical protein V6D19_19035 [Stenomitos sp.]